MRHAAEVRCRPRARASSTAARPGPPRRAPSRRVRPGAPPPRRDPPRRLRRDERRSGERRVLDEPRPGSGRLLGVQARSGSPRGVAGREPVPRRGSGAPRALRARGGVLRPGGRPARPGLRLPAPAHEDRQRPRAQHDGDRAVGAAVARRQAGAADVGPRGRGDTHRTFNLPHASTRPPASAISRPLWASSIS